MTEPRDDAEPSDALPKAGVRRRRWSFPVIWLVPVAAAIVAGYLVYGRLQELGPTITIKFKEADGVKTGQTEIRYRGVPIGEVREIELSEDGEHVLVTALAPLGRFDRERGIGVLDRAPRGGALEHHRLEHGSHWTVHPGASGHGQAEI